MLILTAINQHNRRLTSTVEALLTPDTRALLDTLLQQESADEAAAGSNAAYKLVRGGILSSRRPMTSARHGCGSLCSQQTRSHPCAISSAATWTHGSRSIGRCRIWRR